MPLGLEGGGRPGGAVAGRVDGGGEWVQGCIPLHVVVVVEVEVAVAGGVPSGPPVPPNVHHHIDNFI